MTIYNKIIFSFKKNWSYGWSRFTAASMHTQPPPPYQPPQPYSLHATVAQSYGMQSSNQCPIHRQQQCTCMHQNNTREVYYYFKFLL